MRLVDVLIASVSKQVKPARLWDIVYNNASAANAVHAELLWMSHVLLAFVCRVVVGVSLVLDAW